MKGRKTSIDLLPAASEQNTILNIPVAYDQGFMNVSVNNSLLNISKRDDWQ